MNSCVFWGNLGQTFNESLTFRFCVDTTINNRFHQNLFALDISNISFVPASKNELA